MKLFLFFILANTIALVSAAQISFQEWERESAANKRLLPRYGHLPKSTAEINSDSAFVKQMMALPGSVSRRAASNQLIKLGFNYYYRPDLKTAMDIFNQAYLLDSTNTDIFWGYGAVYMALGQYELAKTQYITGLAIDSLNPHLLTDLATYFMQQYYLMVQMPANKIVKDPRSEARRFMDSSIYYLSKSYALDPVDVNAAYKLSVSYYNIGDCKKAWQYYDVAMALGGRPVTKEFLADLKKLCGEAK